MREIASKNAPEGGAPDFKILFDSMDTDGGGTTSSCLFFFLSRCLYFFFQPLGPAGCSMIPRLGVLDTNEFLVGLKNLGFAVGKRQAAQLTKIFDADGTGKHINNSIF